AVWISAASVAPSCEESGGLAAKRSRKHVSTGSEPTRRRHLTADDPDEFGDGVAPGVTRQSPHGRRPESIIFHEAVGERPVPPVPVAFGVTAVGDGSRDS